jgi:hypothetical protein
LQSCFAFAKLLWNIAPNKLYKIFPDRWGVGARFLLFVCKLYPYKGSTINFVGGGSGRILK